MEENKLEENKKKKNKKSLVSKLLLFTSILLFAVSGLMIFQYFNSINQQFKKATVALKEVDEKVLKSETNLLVEAPISGQLIGRMRVEGLTGDIPIIEGDSLYDAMARGAGHMPQTALPGSGQQVVLSAHRESFFKPLENVKDGDIVVVELPYGTFRYKVSHTKIIHETEPEKLYTPGALEKEELVLFTCYPFSRFAPYVERFLV
ncbi:MAG: class D sortase, partial [Bacilli bacterium]